MRTASGPGRKPVRRHLLIYAYVAPSASTENVDRGCSDVFTKSFSLMVAKSSPVG